MAQSIKLLTRGKILTEAEVDDRQLCLSTVGTIDTQDRDDILEALALTANDIPLDVATVTTTTYAATIANTFILADDDTAAALITITLPAVATAGEGKVIEVKKIGNTANVVIDGNSTETIDGATTLTLSTQYESVALVCSGAAWYIF